MANRLANATSPYLLQHAENPVHWWEWGPEAFAEAKRRDVPVLLSIGYAACHWCHVMAHESFADQATADYLNEHFVAIKVDREERPDVDAVYMNATTAMTGQGGWPMTCVLDAQGRPFFAGTYYPDTPRHGHPSFTQVLTAVVDAWTNRADEVGQAAEALTEHLQSEVSLPPTPLDTAAIDAAVSALAEDYDDEAGGFGSPGPDGGSLAPKFPPSMIARFLHRHIARTGSAQTRNMLEGTLAAMARGGIYDQLAGGFARYAVDRHWVVPHFEKMLYDNAQLLAVYARWDTRLGRRVAAETAEFLLAELRTEEGGFASALDADSEGREGAFYVWNPAQLAQALGSDDGAWAAQVFGVTEAGTFEAGDSTLQYPVDVDDDVRLTRVRAALLAARERRERPERDEKVVAAWNGLAIDGLCAAGWALDEPRYLEAARAAGQLLADSHLIDGRLRRVSRDGEPGSAAGVAEDYGAVADAFITLCEATTDSTWLDRAKVLLAVALDHFAAADGGFYDTADDSEALISRPREITDNAHPSGQSALVHALLRYAAITGSARHAQAADEAMSAVAAVAERAPRFAGWVLAAAEAARTGPEVIVVVGRPGPERDALATAARRRPGAIVLVTTEDHDGQIALLAGRTEVHGRPAAYVCRDQVCNLPVTSAQELLTG